MKDKITCKIKRVCLHILILIFTTTTLAVPASAGLGDKIERGLGSQIAKDIEAESGVVNDPVLAEWVDGIGKKLAEAGGKTDTKYSFKILDTEDVNALAVPGGYVYVTKGLLRFAQSEDEIASVLGHEVGHITARHSMEQMKIQVLSSLLLSVFKNKKYSAAVGGAKLAGLFAMLKFSRDNENEADILGVQKSSTAGYDPKRMMDFFNRMNEKDKSKTSRLESYFMTHPPFAQRIEVISKQQEMQEVGANYAVAAEGLASRKLYEQAREDYRKALKHAPGLASAQDGLKKLPAAQHPVRKQSKDNIQEVKIPADRLKAADERLKTLEKKQAGLQKQLRSTISNLSFASNMIHEYDYTSIREFQLAVDAVYRVSRVIANISSANTSAKDTIDEMPSLAARMSKFGAEADRVRAEYGPATDQVLTELETRLPEVEKSTKKTEQACKSIEFSVRQFVSALMMPRPAEVGMTGLVETQFQMVRKNLNSEILTSRTAVMNLEEARMKIIQSRINLQTCTAGEEKRRMLAERASEYLGLTAKEVLAESEDIGTAVVKAYKTASEKALAARTKKEQQVEIDFDSANIILGLFSWDIDREQKAAERVKELKD